MDRETSHRDQLIICSNINILQCNDFIFLIKTQNTCEAPKPETVDDDGQSTSVVNTPLILWTGGSILVAFLGILFIFFQNHSSSLATIVASLLIPMASFISMRSLGITDNGAALAIGAYCNNYTMIRIVKASADTYKS